MMVAKTDDAQVALQEAIKVRVDRPALPDARARLDRADTGLIDAPLARDPRDRMRMAVSDSARRQAVGHDVPRARALRGGRARRRLHAARVQALHGAHAPDPRAHGLHQAPVRGRPALRRCGRLKADLGLERQFLHAYRLELEHPDHRRASCSSSTRCPRTSPRGSIDRRAARRVARRRATRCSDCSRAAQAVAAPMRTRACLTRLVVATTASVLCVRPLSPVP